jgi:hypothetical protein
MLTVTSGGDLCGFPFSTGHKYLVYGRRLPNGEVYVSISSSTKWAEDATDDQSASVAFRRPHTVRRFMELRFVIPVPITQWLW